MKIHLVTPRELTAEQQSLWRSWQAADEELHSPFLDPAFTCLVAEERPDVRIAILEEDGQCAGFFPFQYRSPHIAIPVGGPLSDRQAVIRRPGYEPQAHELIRGCKLAAYDFHQFTASQPSFHRNGGELQEAVYIDLSAGFDAYCDARRAAGSSILKDTAYKLRRAAREWGELRIEPHTTDLNVLERLVRWKSEQYQRTHAANVFRYGWTVALLKRLLAADRPPLQARLSVLYVGEHIAAVQYCLQWNHVLHDWFPTYDPQFARMSPGLGLKYELLKRAPELGFTRLDLGKNNMHHKASLASHQFRVAKGSVALTPLTRLWRSSVRELRRYRTAPWLQRPYEMAGRYVRPLRGWIQMR